MLSWAYLFRIFGLEPCSALGMASLSSFLEGLADTSCTMLLSLYIFLSIFDPCGVAGVRSMPVFMFVIFSIYLVSLLQFAGPYIWTKIGFVVTKELMQLQKIDDKKMSYIR